MASTKPTIKKRSLLLGVTVIAAALFVAGWAGTRERHPLRWGYGHRHQAAFSAEEVRKRMSRVAKWALDEVKASDAQRAQVQVILDGMASEVAGLQGERQALRDQFIQAVAADPVKTEQVAQVRAASLQLAERAIDRSLEALVKISQVLTPDQRKQLLETWKGRR